MPVLSPHRSTASSGLTGTYRSAAGFGAPLEGGRSAYGGYGGGASYGAPRITAYASERFSTRAYVDSGGRSYYSRAGSITTEDGCTTRFREESVREPSARRDALDAPSPRAATSLTVADSIADLRSKYSASNYVPAVIRNRDASRARSSAAADAGLKVTDEEELTEAEEEEEELEEELEAAEEELNRNLTPASTNPAATNQPRAPADVRPDVDNMRPRDSSDDHDDNGNRRQPVAPPQQPPQPPPGGVSVLEMTRRFERRCVASTSTSTTAATQTAARAGVGRRLAGGGGGGGSGGGAGVAVNSSASVRTEPALTVTALGVRRAKGGAVAAAATSPTKPTPAARGLAPSGRHHVNDFSSYIPVECAASLADGVRTQENGDGAKAGGRKAGKDVNCTSPRLNRSPAASNGGGALGGSSSGRSSLERDGAHPRGGGGGGASCDSSSASSATNSTSASSAGAAPAYERPSPVRQMGLNGLKNIGNTCFMNSVVQCLSNTRPLLEYVRKDGYAADINTTLSSMKGALIKAFAQVIKELWSDDCTDRVVNTVALKSQIQRFAPRFMGYSQQDAQEFLRYLLEGLHEDVNRVTSKPPPAHAEIDEKLSDSEKAAESWQRYLRRDNSKIVDLFVGQFKSTLKCTHCGHCSVTFDPFWDLSLPIPQKTGAIRLAQCLDAFTREETLDGDEKPTCSKCKERRKCTKSFTIHKFPKILVIHLKRFSPTERFRGKLSVTVDFPLEGLDMSGYASESSNLQGRYGLYAVSNHSGTTYSGHYTAYCRHPYSASWHEYNDSRVSSISSKSVVSGEGYVLFYEQDGKVSAHL